jgi:hypothetical protein
MLEEEVQQLNSNNSQQKNALEFLPQPQAKPPHPLLPPSSVTSKQGIPLNLFTDDYVLLID